MNGPWVDGNGNRQFGQPIGVWKDGSGLDYFNTPAKNQMWNEGMAKPFGAPATTPATSPVLDSSATNRLIAKQAYPDSPIERHVAKAFGDEMPKMRDDLIDRKNKGEGFVVRHYHAWTNKDNLQFDTKAQDKTREEEARKRN